MSMIEILMMSAVSASAYPTPFDIQEAIREGGGLLEWLMLGILGLGLYFAGLAASFPMYLVKYREQLGQKGYARRCASLAVNQAGILTRTAMLSCAISIPVLGIPSAIIFGMVNFTLYSGRLNAIPWVLGFIAISLIGSLIAALWFQWRKSADEFKK